MVSTTPIKPTGPAADPKYLPSTHENNPYNFTPQLFAAAKLPPKVTDKYILFFGYEGPDPHVALQQWFPSPFTAPKDPYHGDETEVTFPTSEHFMMHRKALLMNDASTAQKILDAEHPSTAKKLGREVKNFDQKLWVEHADMVVEEANHRKFGQNRELRDMLSETGERELVEASPDDKIWGIGFDSEHALGKESEWGNNGLGKALMRVRERLRKEQEK